MRRIVITGIGIITQLGLGKDVFWEALCKHGSGDVSATRDQDAGRICDFNEHAFMDAKTAKYAQRAEKLALASSGLALADAGLDLTNSPNMSMGVALGSMTSNLSAAASFDRQVLRGDAAFLDPSLVPSGIMNGLSGMVSIKNGLRGFHVPVAAGEASGLMAIQFGLAQLENGRVEGVLAGGVEDVQEDLGLIDLVRNRPAALKHRGGQERSRGIAKETATHPPSEAGAILLFESANHATERGARAYAECAGFGCAYAPGGESNRTSMVQAGSRAIRQASRRCEIRPDDIDLVFTGGDGSSRDDRVEIETMRQFFGPQVPETICVRSVVGDCLGALGAIQVAAAALAIHWSAVPATAGSSNASRGSPRAHTDRGAADIDHVLINSFSGNGHVSCLVLKRAES